MSCAPEPSASLPPPVPEWARAESWTPEQQTHELKRRMLPVAASMQQIDSIKLSPRPTDVIVTTPPKSGTTWVMHICHQLRTGGSEPDFLAQEDVVPILDVSDFLGQDLDTMKQPSEPPRVFATHVPPDKVCGKLWLHHVSSLAFVLYLTHALPSLALTPSLSPSFFPPRYLREAGSLSVSGNSKTWFSQLLGILTVSCHSREGSLCLYCIGVFWIIC